MKRIAFAVVLVAAVTACTAQEEAPMMDTAVAPAAAPAPAPMTDTTMMDTTMTDTSAMDTTVTPPSE